MFFFSISHDKNFGGQDANLEKKCLALYLMMYSFQDERLWLTNAKKDRFEVIAIFLAYIFDL